ncbi:MAG: rhodanese-like domain-containing protein [Bacteroidota bacterium]
MKFLSLFFVFSFFTAGLPAQTVTRINSVEAKNYLNNNDEKSVLIIDGRSSAMFESGHIKNAENIDAFSETAADKLGNHLNRDKILVYCTTRNRSETIIEKLKNLGYDGEIIFVTDGLSGWKANGFDVVTDTNKLTSNPQKSGSQKLMTKLTPIVQVFGSAAYDIENKRYGYSFGRAHLGFQYQFNKDWSAKVIIDRGRATTIDNITVADSTGNMLNVDYTSREGSYYTMWLKFASLRWQVNDRLSLVGGALLQNHYITQERFWEFRYVAQTFQDMYWHIPSTDLGFRANYKINDVFSIDAALTNGEGPRVKQDAFGKVKLAAGLDINTGEKFQSRIYYHHRATGTDSLSTEQLFSFYAGYKPNHTFRIGGEFNYMENLHNASGTDSYGFSIYSSYRLFENTRLFIRFDRLMCDVANNSLSEEKDGNAIIGGVSYSPAKEIKLSLNHQVWFSGKENNGPENNILFSMEYLI